MGEFDRQVENLVSRGYPAAAGISEADFRGRVEQVRPEAERFGEGVAAAGHVPFVLVVGPALVPWTETIGRVTLGDRHGFSVMEPEDPRRFAPIAVAVPPPGDAWLVFDVDTGTEHLNVPPTEALVRIGAAGRSPLTIEEGIALVTHFPDRLVKNACFSLVGSRCTDRRVPALWISDRRPKLGWCWAGNPHTWLGSASCRGRSGDARPGSRRSPPTERSAPELPG